jgi:hypothetical protein
MSGEKPDTTLAPGGDLTNVDLYCLDCGYNLRGLSGDPRRCPECGSPNPIGLTEIPKHLIKRQLRLMDLQTLLMPLSLCTSLLFGVVGVGMVCDKFGRQSGWVLTVTAVAGLGLLGWCVREFRSDCGSQPGWKGLALQYCLLIPIMVLASVILAGLAGRLLGYVLPWQLPGWASTIVGWTIFMLALTPWGPLWRSMERRREQLQRDTARVRARNRLRRRLTTPRRQARLIGRLFGG